MEEWVTELQHRLDAAWRCPDTAVKTVEWALDSGTHALDLEVDMDDRRVTPRTVAHARDTRVPSPSTAMSQLGDPQTVGTLVSDLGAYDPNVRWRAAMVLGELGNSQAVEPLSVALYDNSKRVAQMAAVALGKIGDARAVEPLIAALHDGTEWRQESAAGALLRIGDPAVPSLVVASKGMSRPVRKLARQILARIGTPAALNALDERQTPKRRDHSRLRQLTRSLTRKQPETAPSQVRPPDPAVDDRYRQDDIARGLRATLVAVLATAFAEGGADFGYLQGVFSLAQSQAALYGIPWVDVISSLRELPNLPFVDWLQIGASASLENGQDAGQILEGEHTLTRGPSLYPVSAAD